MKYILLLLFLVHFSSCLRTRAELGESDQTAVYAKRNADNQIESQLEARPDAVPVVTTQTQLASDQEELIRQLNGRVEVLENQLTDLQKERELEKQQTQEKMTLLQEALKKLENQMNGVEPTARAASEVSQDPTMMSSDQIELKKIGGAAAQKSSDKTPAVTPVKGNSFEVGDSYFAKKEWKRAILSFHKFTDEAPKSKLIPEAKYKIGLSFQELGMKEEAMAYFEEVVANYGATEAGKKAKSRLAKMKK